MSKLIDKLTQASPSGRQPMGFGKSKATAAKPKMVLIASLSQANVAKLAHYVAGADACLWHISSSSEIDSWHKSSQKVPDFIWGWWVAGVSRDDMEKILKLGDDFVVFPTDAPATSTPDDKVGRVLQVETSMSDGLLRAINALPVDAVLATAEADEAPVITWQRLASLSRISGLLRKPVLVTIPPNLTADELQSLWDAGADGIVAEVEGGKPPGKIKELRQMIDGLVYSKTRQRSQAEPLLPHIKPDTSQVSEDEEEE
ncbi:MAG: hypothetical protein KKF26_02740 [Chloroflexi bacterium]|nr:hypothetical protein [Chloroflexota bacterium]